MLVDTERWRRDNGGKIVDKEAVVSTPRMGEGIVEDLMVDAIIMVLTNLSGPLKKIARDQPHFQ